MPIDTESLNLSELSQKMAQLKTDLRQVVELSGRITSDKLTYLKEGAVEGMSAIKDGAIAKSRAAVDGLTHTVEDHPLKSIAVSAAIGAAVACLICRR